MPCCARRAVCPSFGEPLEASLLVVVEVVNAVRSLALGMLDTLAAGQAATCSVDLTTMDGQAGPVHPARMLLKIPRAGAAHLSAERCSAGRSGSRAQHAKLAAQAALGAWAGYMGRARPAAS